MTTLTLVTYIAPELLTVNFIKNNTFAHVSSDAWLCSEQDAIVKACDLYSNVGYYAFTEDWKLVSVCKPR